MKRQKRKGRESCAGMKKDELAHGFPKDCILQGEFRKGRRKKKDVRDAKVYRSQTAPG